MVLLKTLSNKEKKELVEKYNLNKEYVNKKDVFSKKNNIYFINKEPVFLEIVYNKKNCLIPFLRDVEKNLKYFNKEFSYVKIDKGAIRFILNGADVMRPGITEVGNFDEEEVILILEENHNKILAIGISVYDSLELKEKNSGKVVKNIHYYNDVFFKEVENK